MTKAWLSVLICLATGAVQALEPPQTKLYDEMFGPWPAPPQITELGWLAKSPDPVARVTRARARDVPRNLSAMVELGRLAFRYPGTLGGYAARQGLSCNVCHPAGQAQTSFELKPYSGRPGHIDITNALFSPLGEDGLHNPVKIPDLRKARAPFGTIQPLDELEPFINRVVRVEFGGTYAHPLILSALTAYVHALKAPQTAGAKSTDAALRKAGHAEQMIRLAFEDLDRAMGVVAAAIAAEDAPLTQFAVAATRSELGRIYERLDPLDPSRASLSLLSEQLREISNAMGRDNLRAARGFVELVYEQLVIEREEVLSRADLTYYNEDYLRAALSPSKPHPLDPPWPPKGADDGSAQ